MCIDGEAYHSVNSTLRKNRRERVYCRKGSQMKRFVIRNYGPSRQFPYKGQSICIANDCAIETDDEEEAAFFKEQEALTVTDRGSELTSSLPVDEPEEPKASDEISYFDMKLKELQILAKDREPPIKTSGLNKAELIQALEDYDRAPVEEEVVVA